MLSDAINSFKARQPGVDSFNKFADDCLELIKSDPDNAIHYLLLSIVARNFVEQVEGQPLSLGDAETERQRITDYGVAVQQALDGSADGKLAVLNRIAVQCS